jgi:hypothetical protein
MTGLDHFKAKWKYYAGGAVHLALALYCVWPNKNPSSAKELVVNAKTVNDKRTIDPATVDFVRIRKHTDGKDTLLTMEKQLSPVQVLEFVQKWNDSRPKGTCKYITRYALEVTLKDKSKRTFRVNGASIKETTDYGYDLGDTTYVEKLWTGIK